MSRSRRARLTLIPLLRTTRPQANVLAGVALLSLILKVLVFNRVPAFFYGAYELGLVTEAILTSIVASYVFYLFVLHLKEQSDKRTIRPYIAKHTSRVVGDCQSQLIEISRVTGIEVSLANASTELIIDAFKKMAPYSNAPLLISPVNMQHANWFKYFDHHKERTRQSISRLLAQLPYIDAKLVSLLTAVDDCSHFYQVEILQNIIVKNVDLSAFALPSPIIAAYVSSSMNIANNTHLARR